MSEDSTPNVNDDTKPSITPEIVAARCALIAQMPIGLRPPRIKELTLEAKPLGYKQSDIEKMINQLLKDKKNEFRQKERVQAASKNTGPVLDRKDPFAAAGVFLREELTQEGVPMVAFWRGLFYRYREGQFIACQADRKNWDDIRDEIIAWLKNCRAEEVDAYGEPVIVDFKPKPADVDAVYDGLAQATKHLGEDEEWRDNREFPHVVPVDNGLLDPVTGDLYQHNPTFFSTRKIHATWNPDLLDDDEFYTAFRNSPCGDFLDEIFADKPEADDGPTQKDLLQEMFGYLLFGDNRLQKGFVIIGPQRSGKGTINKLLSHLLGSTACAPKTRSLASQFGAQGLLDKRLATVTDARIDPKTNFGDLAELLLSITGDDPQDVERKFLTTITVKMMVRFLLLSNALPHLRDPQGVLADRFVYLETAVSFLGKENLSLFDELVAHNSLWLAWALRGYQTLHNKGAKAKFSSTSTHERLSDEAKAEMAPIKTFADRFLVRDTNGVIDTDHIHLAFLDWAETIGIASWPKNKLNARLRKDFRGLRIAQKVVPVITTPFDNDPYFSTVETVKRRCFVGFRWAEGKEPTAAQIVEWKENNSDELN